ncbi:hypothetical protein EI94DRAFT_1833890 [Lactarius quietus]|nr:hypothetical protein EI94DRAFT_1833890 [Lactarius quietus]
MSPDVSCASDQPFTKLAQAAINTPSRICRSKHSRIGLATSIPPPIDASRSALDYKTLLKVKPLPLPLIYIPRSRPAEEALTNILKNMPPPSLQLYKKHLLDCLIQQKKPGVLSRVPGILAGCGFTVDSLVLEDLTINPSPPPHAGTGLVYSMLHVDAHDPARAPRRSVHSRARTPQGPAGGGPSHEPRSRRADEALISILDWLWDIMRFTNLKVSHLPLISSPTPIPPSARRRAFCLMAHGTPSKSPSPIDDTLD